MRKCHRFIQPLFFLFSSLTLVINYFSDKKDHLKQPFKNNIHNYLNLLEYIPKRNYRDNQKRVI